VDMCTGEGSEKKAFYNMDPTARYLLPFSLPRSRVHSRAAPRRAGLRYGEISRG